MRFDIVSSFVIRASSFPSHSRWAIDEGPWNFEPFGQMRRQRLYAKNLGGVMSTEQEIPILGGSHAQEGIRLARFGK